jgi:hypothetical protein
MELPSNPLNLLSDRKIAASALLCTLALGHSGFRAQPESETPKPNYTEGIRIVSFPGAHIVVDLCMGSTWLHEDISAVANDRGSADLTLSVNTKHKHSRYCKDGKITRQDKLPLPVEAPPAHTVTTSA